MRTSNVKQFYKELGRLLYGVALSDKKIQHKEVNALQEFVSKELALSERESDSSGMNKAFYASFEFEAYADKHISVQEAHDSFIKFLDANIMEIKPELIEKAIEAIEKVATSFRKVNKQERAIINMIKTEIREIAEVF
jgi:hypothetical protein